MSLTYGEINSITEKFFVPRLVDNIFQSTAGLMRIKSKCYKKGSGERVMQPLAYATTTAAGRFTGSDTLQTAANDQITAAEFTWKQYYASIQITRLDELKNTGRQAVINFVKSKVQLAEQSLAVILATDLYGDGTTTNSIVGFKAMYAGTGTTYGGISKTTYSWFRGQADTTTTSITYPGLRGTIGDCTIGNDRPTVILTTQDIYDDINALFQPQQRFVDSKTADAGFTNILFEGTPVIVDNYVTSGDCFFVNEKYVDMYYLEDFRFDPFIKPTNQAVSVAHIFWTGALAGSNPRLGGYYDSIA